MKTRPLPRRTFLRGALGGTAVALGLPALEAMLPAGSASAAPLPPIFGLFFWANGMPWHVGHGPGHAFDETPDLWTPTTTGEGYEPSELLAPLSPYSISVVTGLTPKTEIPAVPPGQDDGHMRGFMVAMTGDRIRPEGFDLATHTLSALRPTLDQHVAKHPQFYADDKPPYGSLILGVSTARYHEYGHWNSISYNAPDSLNLPVCSPAELHGMLFGLPPSAELRLRRAALLDAVMADAKSLERRLGAADKARVDAHLTHLSEIQHRLTLTDTTCEAPDAPALSEDLHLKTGIMAELLCAALSCGLTRVFSFMLTSPGSTHVFDNLGVPNDMHSTCHGGEWEPVRKMTAYQMEAFAILLQKMQATKDPTGASLLDRSLVFGTTEYGEGWRHSVAEMSCILAGTANGKLRPNVHVRAPDGNFSIAHVTALRALGLDTPSFGWNGGETSEQFSDLLV
ncbi:MAG: DUF1552 domain-containing protein [Polyangiaceae bacterium]